MKWHIIWYDYDGVYHETYDDKENIDKRLEHIRRIEVGKDHYGTTVLAVIEGHSSFSNNSTLN